MNLNVGKLVLFIFSHTVKYKKNSLWDLEGQEQKCIEMEILK